MIGDDTDLLVLLIFHADLNSHDIFFASERKNAKNRVWNIKEVKSGLGPFVCKHVLFLHAFSGCDTTSRLYGIGKGTIFKKFLQSQAIQQAAAIFDIPHQHKLGEKALAAIYSGKKTDSLNNLQYKKFPFEQRPDKFALVH